MANLMPADMDSVLSTIPSGVDPFSFIARFTLSPLSVTSSTYTIVILLALLLFHSVIVLFCLSLLVMSYVSGVKHARWIIKSFYINDRRVYNCPLYFVNAGILITATQLCSSVAAATYICVQIRSAQSPEYAGDAPLFPPLGFMCIFETLSHWSVTHCFLVTIYVSRGFHQGVKKRVLRWISPPLVINLVFYGIPVCGTIVASIMFFWITLSHHDLAMQVLKALDGFNHGSSTWKKLNQTPPPSTEEMSTIAIELLQAIPKLKKIYTEIGNRAEYFLYSFYRSQISLLVIAITTCLIFIFVSLVLLNKFLSRDEEDDSESDCVVALPQSGNSLSWLRRSTAKNSDTDSTAPNKSRLLMENKQLFYLFLRALGVFLPMITQLDTCSIFVIKHNDVILNNHWREIGTWLVIVSGTWSAFPIAWQCWRLYVDQTRGLIRPIAKKAPKAGRKKPLKFSEIVELEMRREKELAVRLENDLEIGLEKEDEIKSEKDFEFMSDEDLEMISEIVV